jgi:hypothetical protein
VRHSGGIRRRERQSHDLLSTPLDRLPPGEHDRRAGHVVDVDPEVGGVRGGEQGVELPEVGTVGDQVDTVERGGEERREERFERGRGESGGVV